MTSPITVRIDDRLRLLSAVLAAGTWPDHEQTVRPYKTHRAAEHARRYFAAWGAHPAVVALTAQASTDLNGLAAHALANDWPADLAAQLADFQSVAQPQTFWHETQADWAQADWVQAEGDVREVLARADLAQFLTDIFGPLTRALVTAPNLLFPGLQFITVYAPTEVVLYAPPPKAWGASTPWRYSERPDEVQAAFTEAFARALFENELPPAQAALKAQAGTFALAAAVLFLRQAEGDAAGDQFMVMEKRTRNLPRLPIAVNALESLLADRRAGKYASLADYAPQLEGQL